MSRFIELTQHDGDKILLNPERISFVLPYKGYKGCGVGSDGQRLAVRESYAEIKALLMPPPVVSPEAREYIEARKPKEGK